MKKLINNNLKQKIWLTGCITLLFILLRPMMQLMTYENEKRFALTQESLINTMETFFLPGVFTDYVPIAIACVVIAIVFFGYLFSKKQVDLYHSIPVNRKHLFAVNYLSGTIVYLIALFIEYIICVFIAVPNHYMTSESWKNLMVALCMNIVHFMFGYSVAICGIMLSGVIITAIAGAAVIALAFPAAVTLLEYFERYFYVTYAGHSKVKPELLNKLYWLSPVTSFATLIERVRYEWNEYYYENSIMVLSALILPVIMTVLLTGISYYLYKKRPSESAGRAIAFKKTRAFIEVPLAILGGMAGAWFMSTSINTYKTSWIWTGLVLGVLLVHCILEVIINESFKAIFSHKIQLVISLVATVLIIGIYYGDFSNYDKFIPDKTNITSASVYFNEIDNNLSYLQVSEDPANPGLYIVQYKDGSEHAFLNRFTDSVLIEKILGVSQIGVSCVDDMILDKYENDNGSYYEYRDAAMEEKVMLGDSDYYESEGLSEEEAYAQASKWMEENGIQKLDEDTVRKINIEVCYELKNGKIVLRQYTIPLSKVLSAMNEIYKTEEYKDIHFTLNDSFEAGYIHKVEVYDGYDNKVVSVTEEEKDKLLKTYLSELKKLDIDMISNVPIGRIAPLVKVSDVYDETFSGYYIYPEFTQTLGLIEGYGVDISSFTNEIKADELMAVNISSYNMYGYSDDQHLYLDNLSYDDINDSEFLQELAPVLLNASNAWANQLLISNKTNQDNIGIDITANLTPVKGIQRFFPVVIKDGRVPEKIQKDIVIRLWEENR